MEFVIVARSLVDWINSSNHTTLPLGLSGASFKSVIDTTLVESTSQKLFLAGAPKDAINDPLKKILFNREAWTRTITSSERSKLVLHECLGIMQIPDDKYQVSSLVGAIEGPAIDPHEGSGGPWEMGLLCESFLNVEASVFAR